jgi:hypothetical protein
MRFCEWILIESLGSVPVDWRARTSSSWDEGEFEIDGILFKLDFWPDMFSPHIWTAQFYQIYQNGIALDNQQPITFPVMIQLFNTIQDQLVDLLHQNPEIEQMKIRAEAVGPRQNTLTKRNRGYAGSFDLNKSNAYELLFQHSKLHELGYTMERDGDSLVIKRPQKAVA